MTDPYGIAHLYTPDPVEEPHGRPRGHRWRPSPTTLGRLLVALLVALLVLAVVIA